MNISRHIYAVAAIGLVLTAASFGTGHAKLKGAPSATPTNVVVVNSAASPANTRDVTLAGRTPINVQLPQQTIVDGTGSVDHVPMYTVPAGKRLIIQQVYGLATGPTGEYVALGFFAVTDGSNNRLFPIVFDSQDTPGGNIGHCMSNVYYPVDPGMSIQLSLGRTGLTGSTVAIVGFAGYLENAF